MERFTNRSSNGVSSCWQKYSLFGGRKPDDACHIITAIFVDLESNLNSEFVSQGRDLVLSAPVVLTREACHVVPNRARPLFPCTPVACNVFAYGQHVVGRVGCAGVRLVGKVRAIASPKDGFREQLELLAALHDAAGRARCVSATEVRFNKRSMRRLLLLTSNSLSSCSTERTPFHSLVLSSAFKLVKNPHITH